MQLTYIQLDDRIHALNEARDGSSASENRRFDDRLRLCWLYHDLSLEGVVLAEGDLERALEGKAGRDYCDGVLLDTIRRYDRCAQRCVKAVQDREPISMGLLVEYLNTMGVNTESGVLRTSDSASGNYKHDVLAPEKVEAELKAIIARASGNGEFVHPVQLACEVHYAIVQAWPFEEHSALIARIVSHHILMAAGYPQVLFHSNDRQQYYHAFHYDVRRFRKLFRRSMQAQLELYERVFLGNTSSRRHSAA